MPDCAPYVSPSSGTHAEASDHSAVLREPASSGAALRDIPENGLIPMADRRCRREPEEQKPIVPTLGEFYEKTWLPILQASVGPATVTRYMTDFKSHIIPELGDSPIDDLLEELQTLRKQRQKEYFLHGKEMPPSIFLSPGLIIWQDGQQVGRDEGQPWDMKNYYNRVYLKACDKAGIRRRRLHDTRHTLSSATEDATAAAF